MSANLHFDYWDCHNAKKNKNKINIIATPTFDVAFLLATPFENSERNNSHLNRMVPEMGSAARNEFYTPAYLGYSFFFLLNTRKQFNKKERNLVKQVHLIKVSKVINFF